MRDAAQTASSRFPVYVSKAVSQDGFFVAVIYAMAFNTKSKNPLVPLARRSYFAQLLSIIGYCASRYLIGNQEHVLS